MAQSCGLKITVEDKKLVIFTYKKKLKEIIGFFDYKVYKGTFIKETYIANSKH